VSSGLEIIEFTLGDTLYAVNISEVKEIIVASIGLVPVPNTHPSILGAINLRGQVIPVVDLAKHLGKSVEQDNKKARIIISSYNETSVGFLVSDAKSIHRLTEENVEKAADLLQSADRYTSGVINVNEKILFLIKLKAVAAHISDGEELKRVSDE
jgi:two-component system, chemotaxis family, chemotaxis protein CheV